MDFLEEKKVTALVWATSAFHLVANSGVLEKKGSLPPAYCHSGGRPFRPKQLNRWRAALPAVQYTNLYGPTEVTGTVPGTPSSGNSPTTKRNSHRPGLRQQRGLSPG